MPSLRLLSVAVLAGIGAVVAAVNGPDISGVTGTSGSQVRGALVSTPSPGVAPSASSAGPLDVVTENEKAGTKGWRIDAAAGRRPGLAAYAGALSVTAGTSVPLSVDGEGPVRIRALRIGWYGGTGARQVWEGTLRAQPQSGPAKNWVARGWADTTGWPEGHYLLRLDLGPVSRYVPLTVRSSQVAGRVVVLASPMSRQAENGGPGRKKASFTRPYENGYGDGGFLQDDAGIVLAAERTGRKLAYLTDFDVARAPALLDGASALLVGAGSRYWTADLRAAVTRAQDDGTNVAFFGAGTGSRLVRLAPDGRSLTVAGTSASTSVKLTGLRPSCPPATSGPPPASPQPTPTGSSSSTITSSGWVVSNARWWGYDRSGVKTGDVLPGVVRDRFDRAAVTAPGSPAAVQVLSFSKVACAGGPAVAQSGVYLTRPSGAGVFVAGTDGWACVVAGGCVVASGKVVRPGTRSRKVLTRITRTVIAEFSEKAAGSRRSARNSASGYASLR